MTKRIVARCDVSSGDECRGAVVYRAPAASPRNKNRAACLCCDRFVSSCAAMADARLLPGPQPFEPKLHITDEDFKSITHNGLLCDAEGGLGLKEFELVMRDQVLMGSAQSGREGMRPARLLKTLPVIPSILPHPRSNASLHKFR
jgi:hypothetical protein